jgi:hypothetical protein
MALSVTNNNSGAPISTNGTYCAIQVPGYIPPSIAGPGGASPQFQSFSYHLIAGSTGAGTVITFEQLGADSAWHALSTPAPITAASSTTYNNTLQGPWSALRLNVSALAGNGLSYASLTGTPAQASGGQGQSVTSVFVFQAATMMTQLYIDPAGGDLIAKSIAGPNAGKSVNLTFGHWA